jgi:hypothetical protein
MLAAITNHHTAPKKKCEKVNHQKLTVLILLVYSLKKLIPIWNSIDTGKSIKNVKKNGHDSSFDFKKYPYGKTRRTRAV